jgi:catechol 2,3-dioxygenase-like lactoylglutathione lyase family enzyme
MAAVRYIVDDVDAAVTFYTGHLGFALDQQMGPAFALVSHGDLTLWLSGLQSSAARPMPDGSRPEPGAGTASSWRSRISTRKSSG